MGGAIQAVLAHRRRRASRSRSTAGYDLDRVLLTEDLVVRRQRLLRATGVTDGDLLKGVHYAGGGAATQSIVMRSSKINSTGFPKRVQRRDLPVLEDLPQLAAQPDHHHHYRGVEDESRDGIVRDPAAWRSKVMSVK